MCRVQSSQKAEIKEHLWTLEGSSLSLNKKKKGCVCPDDKKQMGFVFLHVFVMFKDMCSRMIEGERNDRVSRIV